MQKNSFAKALDIRPAQASDIDTLFSLDLIAHREEQRREFIRRSVATETCFVAVADEEVAGYGVLNYNFHDNGFIDMLYVKAEHRRAGVGTSLLGHMESLCQTPKLFTSTNLSNLPMQSLLNKFGFELSGVIHNLDAGDPEIVYCKRLTSK